MKLRLPGRRDSRRDDRRVGPDADLTEQLVKAAGKGRPTPKRTEAQGRRTGPAAAAAHHAEGGLQAHACSSRPPGASRRAQGAARGDDSYLPARDRGPVRKLVRDVVDTRRNVGSFFLVIAAVALIGTIVPSLVVRNYASFLLFGFFLLLIVDSVVLSRRIKREGRRALPGRRPKSPRPRLVRHQPVDDDPPLALPEARRRALGAEV